MIHVQSSSSAVCLYLLLLMAAASLPVPQAPSQDGFSACCTLIGNAIRRCVIGNSLSRVTISIKRLENKEASLLSSFQLSRGDLLLMTTEYSEGNVRQYQIYDAFQSPRILQLRSIPKENGYYCGTVVILELTGSAEKCLHDIKNFCSKMEILMLRNIAVEIMSSISLENGCSSEDVTCICGGLSLPPELSNLDRLALGFTNHVSKSCNEDYEPPQRYERGSFKIGKAQSGSSGVASETQWFFETCFLVLEASTTDSIIVRNPETKVMFFEDFTCANITSTVLESLRTRVSWENFGLKVKDIHVDESGVATIEWDDMALLESIALVLHRYRADQMKPVKWPREVNLLKKSVENALNDLKRQNPHTFLSHHSLELQKHVPDLSICISRLISSSADIHFKATCAEILGLPSSEFSRIEPEIRARILDIIKHLDRLSPQCKRQRNENNDSPVATQLDDASRDDDDDGTERVTKSIYCSRT